MLCETFKKLVMKIINYKEKEMIPLTDEEKKFYEKQKSMPPMQKRVFFQWK